MRVLLVQRVAGLGRPGEFHEVSDAYARNFLLPRKLAQTATASVLAAHDQAQKHQAAAAAQQVAQWRALREQLESTKLPLTGKANQQGRLFAALKATDVVTAIHALTGVRPTGLRMTPEHLKDQGESSVVLHWPDSVDQTITVHISHG